MKKITLGELYKELHNIIESGENINTEIRLIVDDDTSSVAGILDLISHDSDYICLFAKED